MIPIIITIGLLLAIISFYKLKFSEKEEEQQKAINYITWGSIGIMIMMSAVYILLQLVNES
jgi:multisubunit Na+/H+ antiporter MnhB subunit